MSIEAAIYQHTSIILAAEVLDRVYPLKLPDSIVLPAVSYQLISPLPRELTHSGRTSLVEDRFQLTLWAMTYDEALLMAGKVIAGWSGFRGSVAGTDITRVEIAGGREDTDPDSGEYRRIIDLLVQYQEV